MKFIAVVLVAGDEFGGERVSEAEGDGVGRTVLFPVGKEGG